MSQRAKGSRYSALKESSAASAVSGFDATMRFTHGNETSGISRMTISRRSRFAEDNRLQIRDAPPDYFGLRLSEGTAVPAGPFREGVVAA